MSLVKWYKRDPQDALNGMMILTLEERGAYNTILDLIYSHDNNLPDDDRFLAGWMQCDIRVWRRIKNRLIELGKIEVRDGLVTNFRATSEVDEALSRVASVSELNRIKGIKSGIARRKNKALAEPSTEPKTNTPTPTPTPTVNTPKEDIESSFVVSRASRSNGPGKGEFEKPKKRATRLPEDWQPLDDDWDKVKASGLSDDEIRYEHQKFTDWARAAPGQKGVKLDWDATWRNWMRKAADDKRGKTERQKAFDARFGAKH